MHKKLILKNPQMKCIVHKIVYDSVSELKSVMNGRKALFVSNSKFDESFYGADCYTTTGFMILSWCKNINVLDYDVVVFYMPEKSQGFLHGLYKNKYKEVHLFLEENVNPEAFGILKNEPRYEIVYLEGKGPIWKDDIFVYTMNRLISKSVVIYSDEKEILEKFPFAKQRSESPENDVCVIVGNYKDNKIGEFKKIIHFLSSSEKSKWGYLCNQHDDSKVNNEKCNQCKNTMLENNNIMIENNNSVIKNVNNNIYKFNEKIMHKPLEYVNILEKLTFYMEMRLCNVGESQFPMKNAYQLLLFIMECCRKVLEEKYFVYCKGNETGWNHAQNKTTLRLYLFDLCVHSDFYIRKMDRMNDCAAKAILWLEKTGVIDSKCNVQEKLGEMSMIERAQKEAYGTKDIKEIIKIRNNYLIRNTDVPKESKMRMEGSKVVYNPEDLVCLNGIHKFKRRYAVDLEKLAGGKSMDQGNMVDFEGKITEEGLFFVETEYRKVAECMKNEYTETYGRVYWLYVFGKGRTGILCGESFRQFSKGESAVWSVGKLKLEARQLMAVKFYQLIFFQCAKISVYPTKQQSMGLHYYAVPLTKTENIIDWAYLNRIFDKFIVAEFAGWNGGIDKLLWNPYEKTFIVYKGRCEKDIGSVIESMENRDELRYFEYFERIFGITLQQRSGLCMIKSITVLNEASKKKKDAAKEKIQQTIFSTSISTKKKTCLKEIGLIETNHENNSIDTKHVNNIIDTKHANNSIDTKHVNNSIDTKHANNSIDTKHVNNIIDTKHVNNSIDTKNVNNSMPITQFKKPNYLLIPEEIVFVTNVELEIIDEAILFVENFHLFENACIYFELNKLFDLRISLSKLASALTSSSENKIDNYERLEFLGDCVLKYLVSNFLYLQNGTLSEIVQVKSNIVSNDNLYKIVMNTNLYRYIITHPYNPRLFQPPVIDCLDSFMRFFCVQSIFTSDNRLHYLLACQHQLKDNNHHKKVYADIYEAIIAVIFLDCGLSQALRFIYNTQLLPSPASSFITFADMPNFFKTYIFSFPHNKTLDYVNIFTPTDLDHIADILGYTFLDPRHLEKAFIHPSYPGNTFSRHHFNTLELLGDAALDLFVVIRLYNTVGYASPEELHTAKKSYVNNQLLGSIILNTNLRHFIKLSDTYFIDYTDKKIPKKFGDIFEAILGAMLCDLNFDFEKFSTFFENKLWKTLQYYRKEFLSSVS